MVIHNISYDCMLLIANLSVETLVIKNNSFESSLMSIDVYKGLELISFQLLCIYIKASCSM
jgi:hypothetical protein